MPAVVYWLPKSLGQLTRLTELTVDGECKELESRRLSRTQLLLLRSLVVLSVITHLPDSLGQLTALSSLRLIACTDLTTLPESLVG